MSSVDVYYQKEERKKEREEERQKGRREDGKSKERKEEKKEEREQGRVSVLDLYSMYSNQICSMIKRITQPMFSLTYAHLPHLTQKLVLLPAPSISCRTKRSDVWV